MADLGSDVPERWVYGGVLLLTAFTFGSTLTFGFVYDDHWTLLGNGFIRDPRNLAAVWTRQPGLDRVPDAFRPTSVAFEILAYQALALSSWRHHLLSVVLHVTATGLLGRWLALEGAPRGLLVTTMTLFGVLALHAEAVAVVSYREDLLAAVAGLAAAAVASAAANSGATRGRSLVAGGLIALACGAKLSAAGLPVAWILMRRLSPWRPPSSGRGVLRPGVALVAGVCFALALRHFALGGIDPYGPTERVFSERAGLSAVLAASAQIHLGYLQQLVLPRGLSPEYVDFAASWADPATVCATTAFAGLVLVAMRGAQQRRAPLVAWVILSAFILAGPTSNLAPMPNMRADRFVYLTSAPLCVGLAATLAALGKALGSRWPQATQMPWIAMVIVQGSMAQGAAAAYRSDARLWQVALNRAPHSARAHAISGQLLTARLRAYPTPYDQPAVLARARAHCQLALHFDVRSDLSHLCAARLAAVEKDWARSYRAFEAAYTLSGVRRDRTMIALASTALDLEAIPYAQRIRHAQQWLERARTEYPYVAEVFAVSGHLRHILGDAAGARQDYRRALELHPERWDLLLAEVDLHLDIGHASGGLAAWRAARPLLVGAPATRQLRTQRRLRRARRLGLDIPSLPNLR